MLPSNRRAPLQRRPSRGGVWCKCDYPRLRQRRTFAGAPTLYLWAATSRWCNGECIAYKSTPPGGSGSQCRFGQEKASEWFPGLGKRQKAELKRRRFTSSSSLDSASLSSQMLTTFLMVPPRASAIGKGSCISRRRKLDQPKGKLEQPKLLMTQTHLSPAGGLA